MKFGEQFPGLCRCRPYSFPGDFPLQYLSFTGVEILEHCLDKQKVRDLIKKFRHYSPTIFDDFEQELKL